MNHAYPMYFVPGAWAMVDGTAYAVHDFSYLSHGTWYIHPPARPPPYIQNVNVFWFILSILTELVFTGV